MIHNDQVSVLGVYAGEKINVYSLYLQQYQYQTHHLVLVHRKPEPHLRCLQGNQWRKRKWIICIWNNDIFYELLCNIVAMIVTSWVFQCFVFFLLLNESFCNISYWFVTIWNNIDVLNGFHSSANCVNFSKSGYFNSLVIHSL